MKLKANAKINLFLDILNKRKDGYHNIKTIFQEISLADEIFINEIKNGETVKKNHNLSLRGAKRRSNLVGGIASSTESADSQ